MRDNTGTIMRDDTGTIDPTPTRVGWICPRCNKVYSPDVQECKECQSTKYFYYPILIPYYPQPVPVIYQTTSTPSYYQTTTNTS